MSTITQTLEDATLALLAVVFSSLAVDCIALPEDPDQYLRTVDRPQVWVAINNIQGGDLMLTAQYAQQTTWRFQIMFRSRKLRDDLGIYNLYDLACKALMGKSPSGASGYFKLLQLQKNGTADGVHDYSMFVECPLWFMVEDFDTESLDGPDLERVTLQSGAQEWETPRA